METKITVLLTPKKLFELGQIVATPGAMNAITDPQRLSYLARHIQGDWGNVCDQDKATNDDGVLIGDRIISAYPIDPARPCKGYGDNCIWIITEADRSVTTFLLPSEY